MASTPTAWRTLAAVDEQVLVAFSRARAQARATAWAAGMDPGFYVLDFDGTLVTAHSEKEGAGGADLQAGVRFHPLLVHLDRDRLPHQVLDRFPGSVGGDPSTVCGAVIRDDKMVEGSWTDPNQMCGAYGVNPGYGVRGTRYQDAVTSTYGAVASASREASEAGIRVLVEGGNAVDAAVATVFAVGVTAQESCGIGGGGFLLYRGADGTAALLDFRETAPANLPADFEAADREHARTNHQVVGVPGTVAGMAAVLDRYGSRPLKRLLAPAIELAERGIGLTPFQIEIIKFNHNRLKYYKESKELYLDNGDVPAPYPVRKKLIQSDLAQTLRTLADRGPNAFYRGSIAEAIVKEMERSQAPGTREGEKGVMTAGDLASYRPIWRDPSRGSYRGREILTVPPPSAGGIMVLEMLNPRRQPVLIPEALPHRGHGVRVERLLDAVPVPVDLRIGRAPKPGVDQLREPAPHQLSPRVPRQRRPTGLEPGLLRRRQVLPHRPSVHVQAGCDLRLRPTRMPVLQDLHVMRNSA